ncbi:hypothetical protein IC582_005187 [Cucumis melo]
MVVVPAVHLVVWTMFEGLITARYLPVAPAVAKIWLLSMVRLHNLISI